MVKKDELELALDLYSRIGFITDKDLKYFISVKPKLLAISSNLSYYIKRYGEDIVISYIRSLIEDVKEEDPAEQLKQIALKLSTLPMKSIMPIIPLITQAISQIEATLVSEGLYDDRIKDAFIRLYDSLSAEHPNIRKVITQLYRIYNIAKVIQPKAFTAPIGTPTTPSLPRVEEIQEVEYRREQIKRARSSSQVDDSLVKLFVEEVNKRNEAGEYPLLSDFIIQFYHKYKDQVKELVTVHRIYKTALSRKYIKEKNKQLYVTESGKEFIS